jgi:hypothetical protein
MADQADARGPGSGVWFAHTYRKKTVAEKAAIRSSALVSSLRSTRTVALKATAFPW